MISENQIKERLAEVIKNSALTQTELANALNIGQSNIAHYIKGDRLPSLETLANLCRVLNVSPAYILCFED